MRKSSRGGPGISMQPLKEETLTSKKTERSVNKRPLAQLKTINTLTGASSVPWIRIRCARLCSPLCAGCPCLANLRRRHALEAAKRRPVRIRPASSEMGPLTLPLSRECGRMLKHHGSCLRHQIRRFFSVRRETPRTANAAQILVQISQALLELYRWRVARGHSDSPNATMHGKLEAVFIGRDFRFL